MKSIFLTLLALTLAGCNSSSGSKSSTSTSPTPATPSSLVTVYSSVENCSTAADVPNCAFEKGIYVLKADSSITDEQHQRVVTQAKNFTIWASEDVQKQLNKKTLIIGIMANEPDGSTAADQFIITLSQAKQIVDGVELVYTAIEGKDETKKATTYQKLMQLFDYYVDDNQNNVLGSELSDSYDAFKVVLLLQDGLASTAGMESLRFNECNYGNGQLSTHRALGTPNPCTDDGSTTDDDGNDISNGTVDPIHEDTNANLNPGSLLGLMYEYRVSPKLSEGGGELIGSAGTKFKVAGEVASGDLDSDPASVFISWANPAFMPLNDYLNKYFFANK
ncbi:histidine ammonia-lyase [Vibrio crassostreae]|uniref:histidine ammonia-lyase n=1 Tax=Vibrio crassostreae TaxID=246167 RepID=UPI004067ABB6